MISYHQAPIERNPLISTSSGYVPEKDKSFCGTCFEMTGVRPSMPDTFDGAIRNKASLKVHVWPQTGSRKENTFFFHRRSVLTLYLLKSWKQSFGKIYYTVREFGPMLFAMRHHSLPLPFHSCMAWIMVREFGPMLSPCIVPLPFHSCMAWIMVREFGPMLFAMRHHSLPLPFHSCMASGGMNYASHFTGGC